MKRTAIVFGLIAGAIVTSMMLWSARECYVNPDFQSNDFLGYTTLIVAFSFIFVGVKNYRDRHNNGVIPFGTAFRVGLFITLVASTLYTLVWLVDYYVFIPDYLDKYIPHVLKEATAAGASAVELDEKTAELTSYKEMYQNPLFVVIITYFEVVPVGLIISLISAWLLRRNAAA